MKRETDGSAGAGVGAHSKSPPSRPPIQYFVPDTVILQSIRAFAFSFGGGKHSSNENPTV